jgi:hypothetical protein
MGEVAKGKWEKGKSGNPAGRPKDQRNITTLKNDLELAVREKLTPAIVTRVVNRMVEIATKGEDKVAVTAGKAILDMAISKAAVQEAVAQRAPITIIIENATLAAMAKEHTASKPIEVEYNVVSSENAG